MKKKKVAIIGTVGIPANYGGFETLTEHFVEELGTQLDISVYCSAKKYKKEERKKSHKGARLIYLPLNANGIQSIIYDSLSIIHALFYANVLIILGVSGGFMIPFVRLLTGKTIITSIDGIEWKRNKWSKMARWYLWASEWLAVRFSHANIADNEAIQDYTAIRYNKLSNIIEYGADHVAINKPGYEEKIKYPFLSLPYAVKVCRIEPENNIHIVLEAFSILEAHALVIVGNWKNSKYGQDLKEKYADYKNIHLLDPIYDPREINIIRSNATVYIHGHSAGGTNPSLVEAMYLQLPVIAFNVTYNRATTENSAVYFKNTEDLVSIIRSKSVRELKDIGSLMGQIAQRRYKWSTIAHKYLFLVNTSNTKRKKQSLLSDIHLNLKHNTMLQQGISHLRHPSFFYEKR